MDSPTSHAISPASSIRLHGSMDDDLQRVSEELRGSSSELTTAAIRHALNVILKSSIVPSGPSELMIDVNALETTLQLLGFPSRTGDAAVSQFKITPGTRNSAPEVTVDGPAAKDLVDAICQRVADVEVVEAYRHQRLSGTPAKAKPDPPKTTTVSGEKFSTEMMASGLRAGWIWLNEWQNDVNPARFDKKGWEHAEGFHGDDWYPMPSVERHVKRSLFFRVQVMLTTAGSMMTPV